MECYADQTDYAALFPEDGEIGGTALAEASRVVDRLTFGRIAAAGGLDALTDNQRELIVEAVCRQAKFASENAPDWSWSVASYSINGVSVKAGHGEGVRYYGGVAVPGEVTMLLDATGLTTRLAGGAV